MPVVEHSTIRMSEAADYHRERILVSREQGATSLTVKEVELQPVWEGRLHTDRHKRGRNPLFRRYRGPPP